MTRPNHIARKKTTCPNCGATVRYDEQRGVRRVVAKWKRCPECDNTFR